MERDSLNLMWGQLVERAKGKSIVRTIESDVSERITFVMSDVEMDKDMSGRIARDKGNFNRAYYTILKVTIEDDGAKDVFGVKDLEIKKPNQNLHPYAQVVKSQLSGNSDIRFHEADTERYLDGAHQDGGDINVLIVPLDQAAKIAEAVSKKVGRVVLFEFMLSPMHIAESKGELEGRIPNLSHESSEQ